jgi:4-alpha-glucanotransferase
MPFARASGVLLHPTCLPSRGGIGDLGPAAYEFVDFLVAAKQALWQVLPLSPLGIHNTPYSSTSAFAGNPLLISLEYLADRGWFDRKRLSVLPDEVRPVDYEQVRATKMPLLREAAENFLRDSSQRGDYDRFCTENSWWLDDFALFNELRRKLNRQSWNLWPRELARRDPAALQQARQHLATNIEATRVLQCLFFSQWRALHRHCDECGIKIIGDNAIFLNYDSADVWMHPDLFQLNGELEPEVVSGVPPDAFSETGQRWGNPLYRWEVLRQRGYSWWVQRMRWALTLCDIIRLDHFRGFEQYWEIPAKEPTAIHGRWVDGPKDDLFHVLRRELGDLPFIAEDLGLITAEVHALRQRLQIPGMRVMQFGFGDPGAHIYLPHRFETNTVVYTGTHDNDTTPGWWKSGARDFEKRDAEALFGPQEDGIHWAFIRAAEGSVADLCVIPLQDFLGVGSEGRMNKPSEVGGNWRWRFQRGDLTPALAQKMARLVEITDREPKKSDQPR